MISFRRTQLLSINILICSEKGNPPSFRDRGKVWTWHTVTHTSGRVLYFDWQLDKVSQVAATGATRVCSVQLRRRQRRLPCPFSFGLLTNQVFCNCSHVDVCFVCFSERCFPQLSAISNERLSNVLNFVSSSCGWEDVNLHLVLATDLYAWTWACHFKSVSWCIETRIII